METFVFKSFPKIPRINKVLNKVIITEKIDGTNASIYIEGGKIRNVGSRKRWITVDNDNFGFAKWVMSNQEKLEELGDGHHFGEYYGSKIQRGYGLKEKKFALFDTKKWLEKELSCCQVVPVLYEGPFVYDNLNIIMSDLLQGGSVISPGYKNPEGIVIYFPETNQLMKHTFENPEGKWKEEN